MSSGSRRRDTCSSSQIGEILSSTNPDGVCSRCDWRYLRSLPDDRGIENCGTCLCGDLSDFAGETRREADNAAGSQSSMVLRAQCILLPRSSDLGDSRGNVVSILPCWHTRYNNTNDESLQRPHPACLQVLAQACVSLRIPKYGVYNRLVVGSSCSRL